MKIPTYEKVKDDCHWAHGDLLNTRFHGADATELEEDALAAALIRISPVLSLNWSMLPMSVRSAMRLMAESVMRARIAVQNGAILQAREGGIEYGLYRFEVESTAEFKTGNEC